MAFTIKKEILLSKILQLNKPLNYILKDSSTENAKRKNIIFDKFKNKVCLNKLVIMTQ